MATLWFVLLSFMLIVYVVLDGFDLGAGILHLAVAKTDTERRTVLRSIGPLWDGNEVWLVAFGGTLVFVFPDVYAVAASGFYLPLMMILWSLVLRGAAIELRSHHENPLWHAFWDATFAIGSTLLAVLFGVALGDLLRGLPIDGSGYFRSPLFGDLRPESASGALDWYTVGVGLYAVLALAAHGALYLRWKTTGAVHDRCDRVARPLWIAVAVGGAVMLALTARVQPGFLGRLSLAEGVGVPLWLLGSLVVLFRSLGRGSDLTAFLASSAYLVGALAGAFASLYPTMLRSTVDGRFDLTIASAAAEPRALGIGLGWWIPAILLAIGYFVYLFRSFRGKVDAAGDGEGHY